MQRIASGKESFSVNLNDEDLDELDTLAQATKGQDPNIRKAGYTAILNDVLARTDTAIDIQKESQAYIQTNMKYASGIVLVMALLLIANFALTISAIEMSKESHVKSGAMTDTGGKIVQVGSSDFTLGSGGEIVQRASAGMAASVGTAPVLSKYKLSSRTPNKYLEELDAFTVTRPCAKDAKNCNSSPTMKVTVKSFKRQPSVGSHCGSVVVLQTDVGEFTLDDDNLYQGDSQMSAAGGLFSLGDRRLANMNISAHGRRLMEEGAAPAVDASVHGAFNFLGNVKADEFVCEMGGVIGKKFSVDPPKPPAVPYAYIVRTEGKCMFEEDDACESDLTQGPKPGVTQHSNFTTMRTYEQVLLTQTHRVVVSYFASQPLSRLVQIIHLEARVYTQYLNFRKSVAKLSCITKPIEGGTKESDSTMAVHLAYLSTSEDADHRSMRWALSPYNAQGSISQNFMEYWERVGTRMPRRIFQHGKNVISHGVSVDFFFSPKEFVEFSPSMTDSEVAQWLHGVLLLEVSQSIAKAAVCPDSEPAGMMPPYLGPFGEAGARWTAPQLQNGDLERFGPTIRWSSSYYKYWSAVVASLGTPTVDFSAPSVDRGEESSERRLSAALKRQKKVAYADNKRAIAYHTGGETEDWPKSKDDMSEFTKCISQAKDCLTNSYMIHDRKAFCFKMLKQAIGALGAEEVTSECSGNGACTGGFDDMTLELACGPCTIGININKLPSFSCIFDSGSGCYWKTSSGELLLVARPFNTLTLWEKWEEHSDLGDGYLACPKSEIIQHDGGDWFSFSCPDGTRVLSGGCNARYNPYKMQASYPDGNGWKCGGHGGGKQGKVICSGRIGTKVVAKHGGDWTDAWCPGSHPRAIGGGCYPKHHPWIVQVNMPANNNGWKCGGHGPAKISFVICVSNAVPIVKKQIDGDDWSANDCGDGEKLVGGGCYVLHHPYRFQVSWPLNDHAWQCGGHGSRKRTWSLCVPKAAMEGEEKCECSEKMSFTLTTRIGAVCAGQPGHRIDFQGEGCGGTAIKWTSMRNIDYAGRKLSGGIAFVPGYNPSDHFKALDEERKKKEEERVRERMRKAIEAAAAKAAEQARNCIWERSGYDKAWQDTWLGQCGVAPNMFPSVPRDCDLCPSTVKFTASTTNDALCALPEGSRIEFVGVQCGGFGNDKIQWNAMRTLDPRSGLTVEQCTFGRSNSDLLQPGYVVAIWNKWHRRFIRMNTGADMDTTGVRGKNELDPNWSWERFHVVDGGDGQIALWNEVHNRFVRMRPNRMDASGHSGRDTMPSGWEWERFYIVHAGHGEIALWNIHHRRFMRMNNRQDMDVSGRREKNALPGGWAWERFQVKVTHHVGPRPNGRRLGGAVAGTAEAARQAYDRRRTPRRRTPRPTPVPWSDTYIGHCGTAPIVLPTLPTTCGELTTPVPTKGSRRLSGGIGFVAGYNPGRVYNRRRTPRRRTPFPTPAPTPAPTPYFDFYDSFLEAHNGEFLDEGEFGLTTSAEKGDTKLWTQKNAHDGKVWLRSKSGKYLGDFNGHIKMSPNAGAWEKWTKEGAGAFGEKPGRKFYLRSHRSIRGHGIYLSAPAGTYGCKICAEIDLSKAGMKIKICVGFDSGCWVYTEVLAERVPPPQWAQITKVTITLTGYIKICFMPEAINGWVKLSVSRGFCWRKWWMVGYSVSFSIYGYLKFEMIWKNNGSGVTMIGTAAVGVTGGVYRPSDVLGVPVGRRRHKCDCSRVGAKGTFTSCPQKAGASGQLTFTLTMTPCKKGEDATLTGTISFAISVNLFGLDIPLPKIPDIQLFSTELRKPFDW